MFVDLLAPPYTQEDSAAAPASSSSSRPLSEEDEEEEETRECDFFKEIPVSSPSRESSAGKVSWLQWIPPPNTYFCDSEEYRGPPVVGQR